MTYTFEVPDKPYEWCYSAKQLEETLNACLVGDKLEAVYVSGTNFADPLKLGKDYVNYYCDSRVYLEFESTHVDICANACGLFEIRLFAGSEVRKTFHSEKLKSGRSYESLCEIACVFQLNYTGETVNQVIVDTVDAWPWDAKGFDETRLGDPIELPYSLAFTFNNGTRLTIRGLDDDFDIKMESVENRV